LLQHFTNDDDGGGDDLFDDVISSGGGGGGGGSSSSISIDLHFTVSICWETCTYPRLSVGLVSVRGREFILFPKVKGCPRN
jgi:hypothetical protein